MPQISSSLKTNEEGYLLTQTWPSDKWPSGFKTGGWKRRKWSTSTRASVKSEIFLKLKYQRGINGRTFDIIYSEIHSIICSTSRDYCGDAQEGKCICVHITNTLTLIKAKILLKNNVPIFTTWFPFFWIYNVFDRKTWEEFKFTVKENQWSKQTNPWQFVYFFYFYFYTSSRFHKNNCTFQTVDSHATLTVH